MNLTKLLRNDGFDLIDGSRRDHKLLQVWSIRGNDSLQLYADELDDIFENKDRINQIRCRRWFCLLIPQAVMSIIST